MNLPVVALTAAVVAWWSVAPFESHDGARGHAPRRMNRYRMAWSRTVIVPWRYRGVRAQGPGKYPLLPPGGYEPTPDTRYRALMRGGNRRLLMTLDGYYGDAKPTRNDRYVGAYPAGVGRPIYDEDGGDDAPGDHHYHPATGNEYDEPAVPQTTARVVGSPSNAFKSADERRLYDFWQFLVNGDAQELLSADGGDDADADDADADADDRGNPSRQRQQSSSGSDVVSQLFENYCKPLIQKLTQQAEERAQPSSASVPAAGTASPAAAVARDDVYELWKSGSPLVKRSAAGAAAGHRPEPSGNDDVRQLDELKTAGVRETGVKVVGNDPRRRDFDGNAVADQRQNVSRG